MNSVIRLVHTELRGHLRVLAAKFLLAAVISSAPYVFSFMGKWLVDEALQVRQTTKPVVAQKVSPIRRLIEKTGLEIRLTAGTTDEKTRLLAVFLGVSLGIHLIVCGLSALSEYVNTNLTHNMVFNMRRKVYEKMQQLDAASFGQEQIGQHMTRILDDTSSIPGNLISLVVNSATQLLMLGLGIYLLSRLNPQLSLLALTPLPFYAITCIIFLPRIRRNSEEIRDRTAAFKGFILEKVSNILTVKNYAQEEREIGRFGEILDDNQKLNREQQKLNLAFNTLTTLITAMATLLVLVVGFLHIKHNRMTLGEVLAFHQVTAHLFVPISALVGLGAVIQNLAISANRIYGVLDKPVTLTSCDNPINPASIEGVIEFRGVSLQYQESGPFAVKDINLQIPAGSSLCIVGPTGCGKSTLIALLTRLYDPSEGEIRIDDTDIRRYPVQRLRSAIGNVFGNAQVFSDTLAANIAFGAPEATQAEIAAAATAVGLDQFANEHPKGYDTRLGHGGEALSREDLARLSFARALVTRPAILAVDDTFASMGEDSEQKLHLFMKKELSDCTRIIATSRLSICPHVDRIVAMRMGRIEQIGSHEELMSSPGVYRRMYRRQMGRS